MDADKIRSGKRELEAEAAACAKDAENGTDRAEHDHVHDPAEHHHVHDPAEKKRQLARLSRIIGHLNYVKRMIEADEDCSVVLMQLAASKSALSGLEKSIISEHLSHCIVHAIQDGDTAMIDEFTQALKKYL